MPDVVIVGGGVIGCATALYLARDGARVTVLERGELAGEASGAAAGMLAALSGEGHERGPAFEAFCQQGAALYDELLPELAQSGIDVRYRRSGVFHLALDEIETANLRALYEMRRGQRDDIAWLEGADILKEEPLANPRAFAAMVSTQEQFVDPQRLTQALAAAAQKRGVTVETNAEVTRLLRDGAGRLRSVRTATKTYEADAFVLAGGPWTARLAKRLGANVPVRPVRGQMLSLNGPPRPLRHMVWGTRAYLLPREDGQTYVGATVEEVGFRKHNTRSALTSLRSGAIGLIPSLSGASQRRAWAGLRPGSADGLPIMGLLPGWQNVWVNTGHFRNGILMASAAGLTMAQSVLTGQTPAEIAAFDPGRF